MYENILLTLGASAADRPIIEHIKRLVAVMHSRVCLLHVASGAPAQIYGANAGGKEVSDGQAYLDQVKQEFEAAGITVTAELGYGDPAREIQKWVEEKGCDLVAMGTHGHKLLADIVLGATASRVQHNISVPVLLLRAR
jgi:nucleotide-binding universal stress UspA family protein